MEIFGNFLGIVVGLFVLLVACWPLTLFLSYRKLAGIERALWAIRSEIERARSAPPREAPAARIAPDTSGAPGPRPVSSSMFGR